MYAPNAADRARSQANESAHPEPRPIHHEAVALVKKFEGLYLTGYLCPAGVPTIGYGHTGKGVKVGMRIDEAQAEDWLETDLEDAAAAVDRLVRVPLNERQRGALASFTFNVGAGAFGKSTLLRRLNAGEYDAVPSELARWNRGGGRVLPGLVKRRATEGALWLGGADAPAERMPQQVEQVAAVPSGWSVILDGLGALLGRA